MNKVYIVSTGEYEDYHVLCIFSTREAAEEYQDIYNSVESNGTSEIEEEIIYTDGKAAAGPYLTIYAYLNWEGEFLKEGNSEVVLCGPFLDSEYLNSTIVGNNVEWFKNHLTWSYVTISTCMLQSEADECRARHADKVEIERKKILKARFQERLDSLKDID